MRLTAKTGWPGVWGVLFILLLGQFHASARQSDPRFSRIDELVRDAMSDKLTPGAVVLVGRGDQTVYEQAFGFRATVPAQEPMTVDTVFDLASLTKVVATTTAMMTLIEDGRVRLQPANPAMQPIMVDADHVQVQGVVVGVMRKY